MEKNSLKADLVIVGAGTMGLYLADRLSKKFNKIIIIEKGNNKIKIVRKKNKFLKGLFHNGFKYNTAIGLGGNSTLWGGQLAEFDKEDFDKNFFWGLNYKEINFFYKKIYKYFNIKKIKKNLFLDFIEEKKINYQNIDKFFTQWLSEPNFFKYFTKRGIKKNINILTNTEILNINFKNKTAKSILVNSNSKKKTIKFEKIILCCGTFNNIKFLLSQKKAPWSKNRFIGKYFQDHIGLNAGTVKVLDSSKFYNIFLNGYIGGEKYSPKIKSRYYVNNFNYGVSGQFVANNQTKHEKINKIIKNYLQKKTFFNFLKIIKIFKFVDLFLLKKILFLILKKKILPNIEKPMTFYIQSEQKPFFNSKLYLKNNKLYLNWCIKGEEIKVIKKFLKDTNRYLINNNIAKINNTKIFKLKDRELVKKIIDTNHPSGGLIISKNKNKGVLNRNLKIWNTSNFYVAGASAFPKSSHANVTLTALALAEKLSNHLIKNIK